MYSTLPINQVLFVGVNGRKGAENVHSGVEIDNLKIHLLCTPRLLVLALNNSTALVLDFTLID